MAGGSCWTIHKRLHRLIYLTKLNIIPSPTPRVRSDIGINHKKILNIRTKLTQLQNGKIWQGTCWASKQIFQKDIYLPIHVCKLQLSVEIFVPGQSIPFHFDTGFEHVRVRVLCPPPHVTLHGPHDDHQLQPPFTDDNQRQQVMTWKL